MDGYRVSQSSFGRTEIIQPTPHPLDPPAALPAYAPPRGGLSDGRGGSNFWRVIWRRRWLAIGPVIVAVGLAIAYIATARPMYTSRGRMDIKPAGSRYAGDNSGDYYQLTNFLYTQREKLLSRDILASVLSMPANVPGAELIKDLRTFRNAANSVDTLRDGLEVEVGKKDDTVLVYFEGPDPNEAQAIVNAVVDNYIQYQTRPHKHSNGQDVLEAIKSKRDEVDHEITAKREQMTAMERQYGLLNGKEQDNVIFRQLASITQTLTAQHQETVKAKQDSDEAAKAVHRDRQADPNLGITTLADDEQSLRLQIGQMQQAIQLYQARYGPEHPTLQQARQRLESMTESYADAVERRYLRNKAIEDDLQKQFDEQNRKAIDVNAKMAEYSHLQEDAARLAKSIETYENRIHEIELQAAAGGVNIDFFDHASYAKQSQPAPKRTMALALLCGLMMGIGLAFFRDWMDDRLRSADEIRNSLAMPVLGVVPQMPAVVSPTVTAQKVVLDPTSDVAEAYRSLRTAIYFGAPKDRSKVILVTSPNSGDGKTTSAANLACVMAQAGKRVLLMDADLRNPRQHVVFGIKPSALGLSGVLAGQIAWGRAIQSTPLPGLDLMQCGPKPRNPSEMLNGHEFSELLETLTDKYDQIIIDSPPVMGLADSRIIAASCDLTLLVLRANKTTRKLSRLSRDGLAAVGANILGVIVNDVPRKSEAFDDSAYGYGRAYGEDKAEPNEPRRKRSLPALTKHDSHV
ncbi:MAG TPA: polysaccharide biosynthesis tyrosine autokinase [Humisphaera sp.]|jgi:capsular exopolysaccharide synthesis family protein|nr:polysaccharide biosynthesis tyrosine autokinase [Humisphaera sp.]